MDFTSAWTPWHRRLWAIGSFLSLEEVHEAGQWMERKVLGNSSVEWHKHALERLLGQDAAIADKVRKQELQKLLRGDLSIASADRRRLRLFIDRCRPGYLERWADKAAEASPPRAELVARSVASHLLDDGHSFSGLQRWIRDGRTGLPAYEVIREASILADQGSSIWEIYVPFKSLPKFEELTEGLSHWVMAQNAPSWLSQCGYTADPDEIGGFIYRVEARDFERAIEIASDLVDRVKARSKFARFTGAVTPCAHVWVKNIKSSQPLTSASRGAHVLSLASEKQIYAVGSGVNRAGGDREEFIDDALELAATLNTGGLAPALSGAWAALESLLTEPRDPTEPGKVIAATRAAQLVACSWSRAELTAIAHQVRERQGDTIASDLKAMKTNRERAEHVAKLIESNAAIPLKKGWRLRSDVAAIERMQELLTNPSGVLNRVHFYLESSLRGLYRARNVVVHGGSTGGIALAGTLRVAAPLVGAALDRITHAYLVSNTPVLELATRAEFNLAHAGDELGPHVCNLLE
ncbi:integrase [Streptomyces rubiginosohelvolus]|uniref:integrase n=1 Tax=Streptomyces rubiginosohelvolus TaxID=67362 RepID=UPI0036406694